MIKLFNKICIGFLWDALEDKVWKAQDEGVISKELLMDALDEAIQSGEDIDALSADMNDIAQRAVRQSSVDHAVGVFDVGKWLADRVKSKGQKKLSIGKRSLRRGDTHFYLSSDKDVSPPASIVSFVKQIEIERDIPMTLNEIFIFDNHASNE